MPVRNGFSCSKSTNDRFFRKLRGGIRGGVSPKTCERAHGWDEDFQGEEDDLQDEDDAIVRALRQRMQQVLIHIHDTS
jgi:hypothetical protein